MEVMQDLNSEQIRAVHSFEGPFLVLAGAGSGKTRVVTYRISHLIESGVPSSQILAVTFTNKAAQEMKERVNELTPHAVLISTFHSLGARILRESIHAFPGYSRNFVIYDEDDVLKIIKGCMESMQLTSQKIEAKTFKNLISRAKNALKSPLDISDFEAESAAEQHFPALYALYQQRMNEYNALDFDDLLFLTVRLFREHPEILAMYQRRWKFLLIDEYQDTNEAQYAMVSHLVEKSHNLFVVGDPDQSIYSWRGAKIHNILNFERDFPGAQTIHLEQNYRSRSTILEAANALIQHNEKRLEKSLWSDRGAGEKIKLFIAETERFEANFITERILHYHQNHRIPFNEMVVFYRTNFQSRVFEDRFLQNGIPYAIVGGLSFYQRKEIKDILAFLRIVNEPSDYVSFVRTINLPKRGFGDVSLEKIRLHAQQNRLSILKFCQALVAEQPLKFPLKLNQKQKEGLKEYVEVCLRLKEIAENSSIQDLVEAAIKESGYIGILKEDVETFQDRNANLKELSSKAKEWEESSLEPSLSAFLEELSLKSTLDDADVQSRVNLMTIHNGKGLEFTVVFLVGLEEDLFPHANARGSFDALEEERRLCYVGMTRAKEYLYLTFARNRNLWGTTRSQRASRFINEVPSEFIEKIRPHERRDSYYSRPLEPLEEDEDIEGALAEELPLEPGDTIFHKDFGVGRINKLYQSSVGLTYQIFFVKDNRERSLVAKYAKLKKL
jgi:DNA helicase-2/ATP-dependent DNA helicase PcrA